MIPVVCNSGLWSGQTPQALSVSSADGVEPTNSSVYNNSAAHHLAAHVVLWLLYLFGVGV